MQCAKHPDVETNLACGKCGKPICPKCLVQTPVGMRCAECAGLKRLPTYQVTSRYYLKAIGVGIGIAIACGVAWWAINLILPFYFLQFFVGAGAGYAIGEVISLAVNRKRGTGLAVVSGICAAFGFAVANVFSFLGGGITHVLLQLLVLVATVFMAVIRFR